MFTPAPPRPMQPGSYNYSLAPSNYIGSPIPSSSVSPLHQPPHRDSTDVGSEKKRYLPGYIAPPAKGPYNPRKAVQYPPKNASPAPSPFQRHGSMSPEQRRGSSTYVRTPAHAQSPYRKISLGGMTPHYALGNATERQRVQNEDEAPPVQSLDEAEFIEPSPKPVPTYDSPMSTSSLDYGLPSPSASNFMPRPSSTAPNTTSKSPAPCTLVIFGAPVRELKDKILPQLQHDYSLDTNAILNAKPLSTSAVEIQVRAPQDVISHLLVQSGELIVDGWTIGVKKSEVKNEIAEPKGGMPQSSYGAMRSSQSMIALNNGLKRSSGSTSTHRQSIILPPDMAFKKQKLSENTARLILPEADDGASKSLLTRLGDVVFGW